MSIAADVLDLTQRFCDVWEADHSTIPYFVDNFPTGEKPAGTFCRFIVSPNEVYHRAGGTDNALMGRTGRVIVHICVPAATGTAQAWALADAAEGIFHLWRGPGGMVRCTDTKIDRTPPSHQDPYYSIKVSTYYESLRHD